MGLVVRPSIKEDFSDIFELLVQLWPDKILAEGLSRQGCIHGGPRQPESCLALLPWAASTRYADFECQRCTNQ